MSEIGMTELRMSDSLRRATNAGDMFRDAIKMSNEAFKEGIALSEEAALRYGTTESQLQLLSNAANKLKVSIGDAVMPMINSIAKGLTAVTTSIAEFLEKHQWIAKIIVPAIAVVGGLAAAITAYGAALKVIKTLELSKYFSPIVNVFKNLSTGRMLPHVS